jgi:hypothetical protein
VQVRGVGVWARVLVAQAEGRHDDALATCREALHDRDYLSDPVAVQVLLELGAESALALASAEVLEELLALAESASVDPTPSIAARLALQHARVGALRGEDDPPFEAAVAALRAIDEPFWIASALLEQAEHLVEHGRFDEIAPLLVEARDVFERLRVTPRLERLDALRAAETMPEPAI